MRKLFLMLALAASITSAMADIAKSVMLHHDGQVTMYDYDEVQKAVDDATDGDTIYLAEGTFSPFNINKRIMVRGAGAGTIVQGNCQINISGTEKLHMPVLDAICFNGTVNVADAYRQFTLRKVKCEDLFFTGTEHHDAKLDRCYIYGVFHLSQNVREFNAVGSKISHLKPYDHTTGQLEFNHCSIYQVQDTITAVFRNSIVGGYSKASIAVKVFIGCYFNNSTSGSSIAESCTVTDSKSGLVYSNCEYNGNPGISSEDGTKIGAYGGQYPFTQNPELPKVSKHAISVDAASKKLNVTLTVDKK